MIGTGETRSGYESKPLALLPPHVEPARIESANEPTKNEPTNIRQQGLGCQQRAVAPQKIKEPVSPMKGRRSRKLAYDLAGAGLIVAGALFSVLNSGNMHTRAMQRAKDQPKEQVVLVNTEISQGSRIGAGFYAPSYIDDVIESAEKENAPEYQANDYSAHSAKAPDDFIRPKTEPTIPKSERSNRNNRSNETPKVLEMMLEAERKGKSEYVFVVDKETQRAKVYKLTYELVDETDVSTGKNLGDKERAGDNKTPNGIFEVQSVQDSSSWRYGGELAYGPKAARLNTGAWDAKGNYYPDKGSDILAHGTNEPENLGSAASHGCVRFPDELIQSYADKGYLKKGTLFAIIENNDYVPARIKAGPLLASEASNAYANNAKQAEQVVQIAQKPASQAYEKYGGNDKKLSIVVDDKPEAKTEAKKEIK